MGKVTKFKFKKIDANFLGTLEGEVSINNNVAIKNLEENDGKLVVSFEYRTKYAQTETEIAYILMAGDLNYLDDSGKVTEFVTEWKKEKKLPSEIMSNVLNFILGRCNVESLKLSQVMNLPSPIPLPEVKVD